MLSGLFQVREDEPMPRWGLNHALHHAPYCFYLANSRLSSRAPSWRGGGQSRHCGRNTSAGTGVTNAELCEAVANIERGLVADLCGGVIKR
jgi:hypothetical protein